MGPGDPGGEAPGGKLSVESCPRRDIDRFRRFSNPGPWPRVDDDEAAEKAVIFQQFARIGEAWPRLAKPWAKRGGHSPPA